MQLCISTGPIVSLNREGSKDGRFVGKSVGTKVGTSVGDVVGDNVGDKVGTEVGISVGSEVGWDDADTSQVFVTSNSSNAVASALLKASVSGASFATTFPVQKHSDALSVST